MSFFMHLIGQINLSAHLNSRRGWEIGLLGEWQSHIEEEQVYQSVENTIGYMLEGEGTIGGESEVERIEMKA